MHILFGIAENEFDSRLTFGTRFYFHFWNFVCRICLNQGLVPKNIHRLGSEVFIVFSKILKNTTFWSRCNQEQRAVSLTITAKIL